MGYLNAFREFSNWTNKRLSDDDNILMSTAKLVFLSKTKSEIVTDHKDYRCLAVQPTFIRILEGIVFARINHK